jgi:hypothetical protein
MMYQFGTVHQDQTPRLRTPLGELSTSSISANSSSDGRALIHQATLFVRSHLAACMTNDEHIIDRSSLLAFILQKLPEKWIDRTYSRIEQYQAKYPGPCFPDTIRVILRNAASLEDETCYTVSYHWTVDMLLDVFISQSGHGHNTFQFLLPSPKERNFVRYSTQSNCKSAKDIGLSTLERLANCKSELVIYYDAVLAPCLLF